MNLVTLKSIFETTTGTNIKQVLFDFSQILNEEVRKLYPYVFWDLDNSKWTDNVRAGYSDVTMDVYVASSFSEFMEDKFSAWDSIESDLKAYLNAINELDFINIDLTKVEKEYYPVSLLSVDEEIGLKYSLTLKLFC